MTIVLQFCPWWGKTGELWSDDPGPILNLMYGSGEKNIRFFKHFADKSEIYILISNLCYVDFND